MAKMPEGLVGTLTGKGFVKSKPKKELSPQLAAAAKRRLVNNAKVGGDSNVTTGASMSYAPGSNVNQ